MRSLGLCPEFEVTVVAQEVRNIGQRFCATLSKQFFHEVISQADVVDALGLPLASVRFKVKFCRGGGFEMLDEAAFDHDFRLASGRESGNVRLPL